ncbi:MAG TPA: C4-type zinc ribbon domain-containing protein [Verrucomicrobiae bacterium]|nr:C4-type zinc ribbon domain-containing protein [Verrucomicrobiae bacterium]
MQKVLQSLLELQSVDVRLNDVQSRLARFPKKIAEVEARIAAAKADVDATKAAQIHAIKERKKYDLDVEQWKERVRKYRDQGSQVKTNEAYRALQHEIQMAEEEIGKAEDRLLEQMVAGEEYDRRIKTSEKTFKEVEAVTNSERSKIEAERTRTEAELAELKAERARAVAEIPESLLDHYDRIVKKHHGIALAEVRDEKCSACGMMIRPHVIQEMRRSGNEEMFHCETCTRILYYVEPSATAPPAAASASATSASEI